MRSYGWIRWKFPYGGSWDDGAYLGFDWSCLGRFIGRKLSCLSLNEEALLIGGIETNGLKKDLSKLIPRL